jgi:hypothetical protein
MPDRLGVAASQAVLMDAYGKFVAGRKLGGGQGSSVYVAEGGGAGAAAGIAIKVFNPGFAAFELDLGASAPAEHAAFLEGAESRIGLQKRAAETSPCVAPVFDTGRVPGAVWCATRLYPRSVERILRERTRLTGGQVVHVLGSVVRGALAFRQTCGRSHGNLKPANVLISGGESLQAAVVAIADPLPGGEDRAEAYERADLRGIGELLYQIVRRREVTGPDWEDLLLPLELTEHWTATFGRDASRWLALCNRLLDRELSLAALDLARLARELDALKPRRRTALLAVGAVAVAAGLGGLGLWRWARPERTGQLTVDSEPAGAALLLNGVPVGNTPWSRKLPPGRVALVASNELGTLPADLTVVAGQVTPHTFRFEYGAVRLASEPPGATVHDADDRPLGTTPWASGRLRPGSHSFVVRLPQHHPVAVQASVAADGRTNALPVATLRRVTGPNVSVIVKVEPRELGRAVVITNLATQQSGVGSPGVFELPPGASRFELVLPEPWPVRTFAVNVGTNSEQTFVERIPAGRIDLDSEPAGAAVWVGTQLAGQTPVNRLWPTGSYAFEWRLAFHSTNRFETNLADGGVVQRRETLKELLRPVRLVANIDGVRVYATNAELGRFGGWRVGPGGTNVGLPGTNVLIAEFADEERGRLGPVVQTNAAADRTTTNEYAFRFAYRAVDVRVPTGATVAVEGRELSQRPVRRYQALGEAVTYAVAAEHFHPTNLTLRFDQEGDGVSTNVVLTARLYPVILDVAPPVAEVRLLASGVVLTHGPNALPWGDGRYLVTASHPRLGAVTGVVVLAEQGVTQSLALAHARISIATRQRGLVVSEGTATLGRTPLTNLYLPPGDHRFSFASRAGSTNWGTNLVDGAGVEVSLPFQFLPDAVTNSLGIQLVYVGEADLYVQQFETTREQYKGLLPLPADPVPCGGPDCPVVLVGWTNVVDFCAGLNGHSAERTLLAANDLEGWIYAIPTESEWGVFAPAADLGNEPEAVFATFSGPQAIRAARRSANRYQVFDLHGNVAEFCLGTDGARLLMGGSYLTTKRTARQPAPEQALIGRAPEVGFRVVLKRPGS